MSRSPARLCLFVAVMALSCATQREQRVSAADARERPSDAGCEPVGAPPAPDMVWACGYWHWDAVRYVWVEGSWQRPGPDW
jgi:hypothetical protein